MLLQEKAVFITCIVSCLLFITCAVLYDFHRYDLFVLVRVSNEAGMIEQALTQTPVCAPDDRSRQRALLHTLQAWTHLAHPHHVRYWISRQALLSQAESHGSLPYARSIDVSMMADDIPQLLRLINVNISSTYELQVHPQWSTVPVIKRSSVPSQKIDFVKDPARFINRQKNVSINIWPVYDSSSDKNMLIEYDIRTKGHTFLEEWIFPLHPCFFGGVKVWCPEEPRKLLKSMFGARWTTELRVECINSEWVTQQSE